MFPSLSGAALQAAAANTKGAFGPDGWLAAELALLPISWWDSIALVFSCIEESEECPLSSCKPPFSLFPRGTDWTL